MADDSSSTATRPLISPYSPDSAATAASEYGYALSGMVGASLSRFRLDAAGNEGQDVSIGVDDENVDSSNAPKLRMNPGEYGVKPRTALGVSGRTSSLGEVSLPTIGRTPDQMLYPSRKHSGCDNGDVAAP